MESLRMLAHVLMLQFILSLTCRRLSVTQAWIIRTCSPPVTPALYAMHLCRIQPLALIVSIDRAEDLCVSTEESHVYTRYDADAQYKILRRFYVCIKH